MEIIELSNDSEYLDKFYKLYQTIFSNSDETDSKEAIRKHLFLKNTKFYGSNSYHLFCEKEGENIIGFIIGDYYSEPNSGVIEYVAVKSEYRARGYGKELIKHFTNAITNDAGKDIDGIYCEVDIKPLRDSNNAGLTSLKFWDNCGYNVVEVNYVQPALDSSKKPVQYLVLMYKDQKGSGLLVNGLKTFIKSYMKYAMCIIHPDGTEEFKLLEKQLNGKTYVVLLPVDEYIKIDTNLFKDPAVDYIVTFPIIDYGGKIEDLKELSADDFTSFSKKIKEKLKNLDFVRTILLEVQTEVKEPVWNTKTYDQFILQMRSNRDKKFNDNYLNGKTSLKGVLELWPDISFSAELPFRSVHASKVQIWLDVNYRRLASVHFIFYYEGLYSTREMIYLTEAKNVSLLHIEAEEDLLSYASQIVYLLRTSKEKSTGLSKQEGFELYPLSFATTGNNFQQIKTHIYAVVNQDLSYDYANIRYIKKFFDEDLSVLEMVYVHNGINSSVVIFRNYTPELFFAVTDYYISVLSMDNPKEFKDPAKIAILNEYISEVTPLLHEKLYLKMLEKELLKVEKKELSLKEKNELSWTEEKKMLESITNLEISFYLDLEKFRELSYSPYIEVDFALQQARSDMGIMDKLNTIKTRMESLSKLNEVLYRIKNDFTNSDFVFLTYLLTLFTAATLAVTLTNLVFPSAPVFTKVLLIFILPIFAITGLHIFRLNRKQKSNKKI